MTTKRRIVKPAQNKKITGRYLAKRSNGFAAPSQRCGILVERIEQENPAILGKFLDLVWRDIQKNPSSLEAYTEEMSQEDDELLAGVVIDQ
jgi:hypothetical protein